MTFYSSVILLTELLMLAMTLHVIHYSGFTRAQKTWYLLTFLSVMICSAAEFAVHGIPYKPIYATPLTVLTVLQFSLAPLLGVFFSGALGQHRQAKIASFIFSLNFLVEAALAPFGLVFTFNTDGYFRGPLFFVYGIFYILSLIYLIVTMIFVGKKFRHRDFRTIIMILVILIAGIVPMTVFKINITYIAIAVSAALCYIYYNDLVQQDTHAELMAQQKKITSMQEHIISGLANLIENRDTDTGKHVSRTSAYVKTLAEDARADGVYTEEINEHFITLMYALAPMHDVGKILVSDSILRKPAKLTAEEFEQMKLHSTNGNTVVREILQGITDEEYLSFAADVATYHHERWDGTGYPKGLKGTEIPLCARIMAIADVFDALISVRCYKAAMTREEAFRIIEEESGSHFDPKLVEVFLNHKDEFVSD